MNNRERQIIEKYEEGYGMFKVAIILGTTQQKVYTTLKKYAPEIIRKKSTQSKYEGNTKYSIRDYYYNEPSSRYEWKF